MPSTLQAPALPENLSAGIDRLDDLMYDRNDRRTLLQRAFALRSGRERPGQFWKIDLDALDFSEWKIAAPSIPKIVAPDKKRIVACTFPISAREHRDMAFKAYVSLTHIREQKFGLLAAALCNTGVFIYIPPDIAIDDPIEITYAAGDDALFPYTLVMVDRGARCTIVERIEGKGGARVCGLCEIVAAENAALTYAVDQRLPSDAQAIFTRASSPGKDASVTWCLAELGAGLAVTSVDVAIDKPGAQAIINGLFFPRGEQHVDLVSTVRHNVGESRSETIIKSAATDRGQARYLGNIRIAAHAQGTQASLRDDALLLSPKAHIDSVPALEIGANDVKAFHGATIGALDQNVIFYMESRGIERAQAEKMVALGFFEPVVERFPTAELRERLRSALQTKIA